MDGLWIYLHTSEGKVVLAVAVAFLFLVFLALALGRR